MIDTSKNVRIYDDTGGGDTFELREVLYEDDTTIIGNVYNDDWYDGPLKVMINKVKGTVAHDELNFYLAENY